MTTNDLKALIKELAELNQRYAAGELDDLEFADQVSATADYLSNAASEIVGELAPLEPLAL